jgi:hypothetical protein
VRRNKVVLSVTTTLVFLAAALFASAFLHLKEFRAGKYGGITVNSQPMGAEVWRDGRMIGVTPFKVAGVPLGEFAYSLMLTNYEAVTNTTTLVSKKQINDFTFLRPTEQRSPRTIPGVGTNVAELNAIAPHGAVILTMHGTVEVARRGATEWLPAKLDMLMEVGDRLRTGNNGRTTLRLSDLSIVRVNELTLISIQPQGTGKLNQHSLELRGGALRFLEMGSNPIVSPAGSFQIRD